MTSMAAAPAAAPAMMTVLLLLLLLLLLPLTLPPAAVMGSPAKTAARASALVPLSATTDTPLTFMEVR